MFILRRKSDDGDAAIMAWLALAAIYILYLYFLFWAGNGLTKLLRGNRPDNRVPRSYSLILPVHNEGRNLHTCLPALMAQDYPAERYEIIVVADRCSDDTVAIARAYQEQFANLKVLEVWDTPDGVAPKKHALARAIRQARYGHLVFVDSDVRVSPAHLKIFNRYFGDDTAALVSLMKLEPPQNFWQRFLVFEKLVSWMIAGAAVGYRRPIISYGGNWAYTLSAFRAVGGFSAIETSLSGDDDLLLQQISRAGLPVQFCLLPEGWTRMPFPGSFRHFLRQRRRHFSAGKRYRRSVQAGYLGFHGANLLLWAGIFFGTAGWTFLGLKLLSDWLLLRRGEKIFRERLPAYLFPLFNFLFMLYNILIGPLGHVGKIRW